MTPSSRRSAILWLSLAAIAGLSVRLASIHGSLWIDEFLTLWAVDTSFDQMLSRVSQAMVISPFYFVLPWLSVHAFGESELALRLPSLMAIVGCTALVGTAAGSLGGRRAAFWAGVLFWLSYSATWESINARPYALAWLFVALATLGFIRTCQSGSPRWRAVWVLGAAGVGWAHYIYLPFVGGLAASAVFNRRLRTSYPAHRLAADGLAIGALVLPTLPLIAVTAVQHDAHAWSLTWRPLALVAALVPFLPAALMPSRPAAPPAAAALNAALWLGAATQIGIIALISALHVDLTASRYVAPAMIGVAILAGANLARLSRANLAAPLVLYGLATSAAFYATYAVCGSLSGAGYQQWREAVQVMRESVQRDPGAPVLFRSGYTEDDASAPGHTNSPATLSPLRSPGNSMVDWPIISLTYRWNSPTRASYFDHVVAPAIADRQVFYVLCLVSNEPAAHGYCGDVEQWIAERWPDRFRVEPIGTFRQLVAVRVVAQRRQGAAGASHSAHQPEPVVRVPE